jgi:uncharacterized FAD-dependent dehydrogenase
MQKQLQLRLTPQEATDDQLIIERIAAETGEPLSAITGFHLLRQSVDARSRQVFYQVTVNAFIQEPFTERPVKGTILRDVHRAKHRVIVVGAGPAGLFAALQLIEDGIQPIVIERGKDVKARRRDLAALNKEGVINPESNYCFGEGGAGTYSDGKLYTRSSKRGDIHRILNIFVQFGAAEHILYQAHPHIGTNKLPQIITAMREQIIACGGEVHFNTRLTAFITDKGVLKGIRTADNTSFEAEAVILATGHSARDIFEVLHAQQILIEAKPFALGVRVEHPQALINTIQYHHNVSNPLLPPAAYSLVEQVNGRGVFSFCMCPGGIIAPAATAPGELVVNGWSPSKRNNPYANSGMVVQVSAADVLKTDKGKQFRDMHDHPLLLMAFQQMVEATAYTAGGGHFVAPAQRLVDFCENRVSATLPDCSYVPGLKSTGLQFVLPGFVHTTLQQGFKAFGKKMRGYYTNEALVVATESRTSSPVRIPRNPDTLEHPQIRRLYPCGEGAGYAGGIVSAAMDGERVARQIAVVLAGA